jgi:hypothetical protein
MKIVTEISADIHTTLEPVNTPHSVIRNRGCEDDSTRSTFVAGGRAHNLTKDCESGTSDRKVPDDADPGPGTRNLTDDNNTAEETVEKEAGPGAGDAIGNAGPDVGDATDDAGPGAGDAVDDVGPVTRDVTDAVVTAVVDETICESPGGINAAGDEGFDAESKLGEGGPAVGDVIVVASSGARDMTDEASRQQRDVMDAVGPRLRTNGAGPDAEVAAGEVGPRAENETGAADPDLEEVTGDTGPAGTEVINEVKTKSEPAFENTDCDVRNTADNLDPGKGIISGDTSPRTFNATGETDPGEGRINDDASPVGRKVTDNKGPAAVIAIGATKGTQIASIAVKEATLSDNRPIGGIQDDSIKTSPALPAADLRSLLGGNRERHPTVNKTVHTQAWVPSNIYEAEQALRPFDCSSQWGPPSSTTRLERWTRRQKLVALPEDWRWVETILQRFPALGHLKASEQYRESGHSGLITAPASSTRPVPTQHKNKCLY